mgnify:CR=1 FL=1
MKVMNKICVFLIFFYSSQIIANNSDDNSFLLEDFLNKIQMKQGIASFTQKKHFTFLTNPIISKGLLKIHQNNVIWQTEKPVFSKLVVVEDQVWQLIERSNGLQANKYRNVASHTSIETLIRAVFTGEINTAQWNANLDEKKCLQLAPKDLLLSQAITQIKVCLTNNSNQKFVTITDAQSNLTEIEIMTLTNQLTSDDLREFNIN